jgi:hypothetical protein
VRGSDKNETHVAYNRAAKSKVVRMEWLLYVANKQPWVASGPDACATCAFSSSEQMPDIGGANGGMGNELELNVISVSSC